MRDGRLCGRNWSISLPPRPVLITCLILRRAVLTTKGWVRLLRPKCAFLHSWAIAACELMRFVRRLHAAVISAFLLRADICLQIEFASKFASCVSVNRCGPFRDSRALIQPVYCGHHVCVVSDVVGDWKCCNGVSNRSPFYPSK